MEKICDLQSLELFENDVVQITPPLWQVVHLAVSYFLHPPLSSDLPLKRIDVNVRKGVLSLSSQLVDR